MDTERAGHGWLEAIAGALPDLLFVVDETGCYEEVLGGQARLLYDSASFLKGNRMHDVLPAETADRFLSAVRKCIESDSLLVLEYRLASAQVAGNTADGPAGTQWFEARLFPIRSLTSGPRSVVWLAVNISERKQQETALMRAQNEIRTLKGLLPICANCKRIRDAEGQWHEVEKYIERRAQVTFSHGLCPECMKSLYPDVSL